MVVFNDIDAVQIVQREATDEKKINLSHLLEILDGYCYFKNCVVILTTNHVEKLDPAIIREGRIDMKFEFKKKL